MFIRLLVTCIFLIVVVQSAVTNSSKGQNAAALTLPKQASLYDDYDLNDHKTSGGHVEGSGGDASLDEYADDDDEQLSKVTATTIRSNTSAITPTTTTVLTTTIQRIISTTTQSNKWMKTTTHSEELKKKSQSSTTSSSFNDLDASEFKDDPEEYTDDLEDAAYYNEPTAPNKISLTSFSSTRYLTPTTRPSLAVNHTTPIWALFGILTHPSIAAGILAGLAIGILTSVILLVCIIRRYQKREKSHSSYTTGLLYPNQYGYSKSPQEFYA